MELLGEIATRQTKFRCIAQKAKEDKGLSFTSLAHHLTEEYLLTSFRKLRKSAASGIDKVSAYEYELNLLERIESLHERTVICLKYFHSPNLKLCTIMYKLATDSERKYRGTGYGKTVSPFLRGDRWNNSLFYLNCT